MAKNWIKGAIKHPGALRETAKREKLIKGNAPLSETVLGKLASHGNATTKKRVNLARTLSKMHK